MTRSILKAMNRLFGCTVFTLLTMGSAAAAEPYQQLQQEWWQWATSIPASINPIYDKIGNRCGLAQRGDFWFLAGSTGGSITRSCTIPQGAKLVVPIVNTFCFPDASISAADCITESDGFIESYEPADLTLTADGQAVPYADVRDVNEWFVTFDKNGLFGYKPGVYKANIARGYWGVIDTGGWGPGTVHTVHLAARGAFSLAVTYKVTVARHRNSDYLP